MQHAAFNPHRFSVLFQLDLNNGKHRLMLTDPWSVLVSILTRTRVLLAWARWGCAPGVPGSLVALLWALATAPDVPFVQAPAPGPVLRGRCLMPSNRRTRRMLLGSSSTAHSTNVRHSGQRSSPREPRIPWRHRRQKVCWQGRTFAEASSRSRQTGHSSKSNSTDSSILCVFSHHLSRKTWCWYGFCLDAGPVLSRHSHISAVAMASASALRVKTCKSIKRTAWNRSCCASRHTT